MYITEIELENIKNIEKLEVKFPEPYHGWHVFIGDNGSGKTTFLQAISLVLTFGDDGSFSLNLTDINGKDKEWRIELKLFIDTEMDKWSNNYPFDIWKKLYLTYSNKGRKPQTGGNVLLYGAIKGFFSASYGPYRRFSGGSENFIKLFENYPRTAAHLSLFNEGVSLSISLKWLVQLNYKRLEGNKEAKIILETVEYFINSETVAALLPYSSKLSKVSSDGVFIRHADGTEINILTTSDGFRSILSMTLELIRYMIAIYGLEKVFPPDNPTPETITLPGVVLIDEIDAHLHPTWQTRVGDWFTARFPALQFIVTTHSPLICRACEKNNGMIFRLAAPGSNISSGEVTGRDKQKLIYGHILDAYDTELFGENIEQSPHAAELKQRLAELNMKKTLRIITDEEEILRKELKEKVG